VATATNEVEELQRRMAEIRRDLHESVRDVVATAEAVTDWRRYIRMYPWVALGAAAAVGYVVVPKRKKAVPVTIATESDMVKLQKAAGGAAETVKKNPKKSLLAAGLGLLAPVAVRAIQGYAVGYLESWIAQMQVQQAAQGARASSSGSPHQHPSSGPGYPAGS
jgi:hypothetical protein